MADAVKLWRYYLPAGPGQEWAEIVMTSTGMFAATSDWGNYSYAWRSIGCSDFREFMARMDHDPGYVMGKIALGDEYMPEETLAAVKKAILEATASSDIDRDTARACFDELADSYDSLSDEFQFSRWIYDSDGARKIGDAHELAVFDYPSDVRAFCARIIPRLAEALRAELVAERSASNA